MTDRTKTICPPIFDLGGIKKDMVTLILLSRLIIGMIMEYMIYIYNYSRIFMEPFENFLLYMIQVTVHDTSQCT